MAAPERGDGYVLLTVLPHDEAIRWASHHVITVNAVSGALEVRNVVAIEHLSRGLEQVSAAQPERLFDHVSDADLRRLGIDDQVLPLVRLLVEEDPLRHTEELLRERCLLFVACTRAWEALRVWHGQPSPFLADLGVGI